MKSKSNKKYLNEGIENISSSMSLPKFPRGQHPTTLGVLFCYNTLWKRSQTLLNNLRKSTEANKWHIPDLICSLDPGFLLAATDTLGKSIARLGTLVSGMESDDEPLPGRFALIRPLGEFSREHILLWFHLMVIDYLIDFALEDRPISPSFYDGLKAQEVIDAAIESHETGHWVTP